MIKEFNSLEEIQKYYDKETNTYVFKENDGYIGLVVFNFDLDVKANIDAMNINALNIIAKNIDARDIYASDIKAYNINALSIEAMDISASDINVNDITYYAICFAYNNIKCKSIKGRRNNAKHFVLDGKLEVENNE